MLGLTLKYEEEVKIGEDITVVVKQKVRGSGVMVLIDAPKHIPIKLKKRKKENEQGA